MPYCCVPVYSMLYLSTLVCIFQAVHVPHCCVYFRLYMCHTGVYIPGCACATLLYIFQVVHVPPCCVNSRLYLCHTVVYMPGCTLLCVFRAVHVPHCCVYFSLNFRLYMCNTVVFISGCTCATLLCIFLLIFLFLVKRICIAIELIKEASRYGSIMRKSAVCTCAQPCKVQISLCN